MDLSDADAAWTDEKWAETERETEEWGKHMARLRAQVCVVLRSCHRYPECLATQAP